VRGLCQNTLFPRTLTQLRQRSRESCVVVGCGGVWMCCGVCSVWAVPDGASGIMWQVAHRIAHRVVDTPGHQRITTVTTHDFD